MTGAITALGEAAGEMATGAAWSRVAEPFAGEAGHGGAGHDGAGHGEVTGPCLNCGTQLTGRYCHACGQSAHVHRTLMSIVHDLLHGVFHFEGKIWHTVPMLVLHPGQLTRRYVAGERARFVSPLALFLFTVFLMFAVYSAVGPGDFGRGIADGWNSVDTAVSATRARTSAELARAETMRVELVAARRPTAAVDADIERLRHDLQTLPAMQGTSDARSSRLRVHSNIRWLDDGLNRAKENPGLAIYKVQSAAYKFSWALILLSTPFVALLFVWRRRFGMYDHATFVTYSIAFMSLLVIALELLLAASAPEVLIAGLLTLVPPVHMFAQLRGAYALSKVSALWRTIVLLAFAWFALALFVVGVIALEVAH